MKRYIIVDENNKIIGYKEKSDILPTDIFRVSACIIQNSQGKYLLAQRAFSKKNKPGIWAYTAEGTLEKGETYKENIQRELFEEIGIRSLNIEKILQKRRYGAHTFFHEVYYTKQDINIDDLVMDENEVQAVRWFTYDEIQQEHFKGNKISKKLQRDILFLRDGIETDY